MINNLTFRCPWCFHVLCAPDERHTCLWFDSPYFITFVVDGAPLVECTQCFALIEFHGQFHNCPSGGDTYIVDDATAALLTSLFPEEFPENEWEECDWISSGKTPCYSISLRHRNRLSTKLIKTLKSWHTARKGRNRLLYVIQNSGGFSDKEFIKASKHHHNLSLMRYPFLV